MRRSDVRVGDFIEGAGRPVTALKWTDVGHTPERGALMTGGNVPAFMKRSAVAAPVRFGEPSTLKAIGEQQDALRRKLDALVAALKARRA